MSIKSIDINSINSKFLKEKKYLKIFPEYYDLAKVSENGLWHDNQNVLDHVIGVFKGLEVVLMFKGLNAHDENILRKYLSEIVGKRTRKELLIVSTLLHDIAKTDTLIRLPDGTAGCPGHELIAAGRVKNFSDRFGFNKKDEEYVERIVRYHGLISDFLSLIIAKGSKEKYLKMFRGTVEDVAIELVLFMRSDLHGSDLDKNDMKAFDDRVAILSWMLKKLISLHN